MQGWRWNLDYVVDVHGNAEALYYHAETNHYAINGTDRDRLRPRRSLDRIEYGLKATTVYSANAATGKVTSATTRSVVAGRTNCTTEALTTGPRLRPTRPSTRTSPSTSTAPPLLPGSDVTHVLDRRKLNTVTTKGSQYTGPTPTSTCGPSPTPSPTRATAPTTPLVDPGHTHRPRRRRPITEPDDLHQRRPAEPGLARRVRAPG